MSDIHYHHVPEYALSAEMLPALFVLGDLMPGGLFMYKAEEPLELIYANRATLRIFGCDTLEQFKELTGYTFRGLVHPEDFEAIQNSINSQIEETGAEEEKLDFVEYRITRRDGSVRYVTDGIAVDFSGNLRGFSHNNRDRARHECIYQFLSKRSYLGNDILDQCLYLLAGLKYLDGILNPSP